MATLDNTIAKPVACISKPVPYLQSNSARHRVKVINPLQTETLHAVRAGLALHARPNPKFSTFLALTLNSRSSQGRKRFPSWGLTLGEIKWQLVDMKERSLKVYLDEPSFPIEFCPRCGCLY